MDSNKRLIIHYVLLVISTTSLGYVIGREQWVFVSAILIVLIVIQWALLFRYLKQKKNQLKEFVEIIKNEETSSIHIESKQFSYSEYQDYFLILQNLYQKLKLDRERQFRLLEKLVDQLPSGVILVQNKKLILSNKTARNLLQMPVGESFLGFEKKFPDLVRLINSGLNAEAQLVQVSLEGKEYRLLYSLDEFSMESDSIRMLSFLDVDNTLTRTETKAWYQLIRTIAHELMNAVAPISSLSETGAKIIAKIKTDSSEEKVEMEYKSIQMLERAMKSIQNKSTHVKKFVNDIRSLSKLTIPNMAVLNLKSILEPVMEGMRAMFPEVEIRYDEESNFEFSVDAGQLQQLLINLLKNACEAAMDNKSQTAVVKFQCFIVDSCVRLEVFDSGTGISNEDHSQLFMPFFTRKENGSGIGLSICKQIMDLHKGNIGFSTENGTCFYVEFPINND